MSYQALYRTWRPETFSEICGQDAVVRTLKRQVETGRIAHAYLFCGTRGTGKTTAAKVLSRAINCLNPVNGDPCGVCEVCQALKKENSMDVMEIDAASNNGVDEIRDLREKIKYPPTLTRYKVYIIDEVHMLSTGAFNALLKTLEEPPKHAVFILATTEPQKLPATILSRCQRFDFHRIGVETIVDRLMVVLGGIGREADEDALYEIARAAEGAMRDALSLMDVCLSFTEGTITSELAREVLGTAGRGFMFEFTDALIALDAGAALLKIDEAMRRGSDPQVFARDTTAHLRAILMARFAKDQLDKLIEVTREDAERFLEQAKAASAEQLMRQMELFMRAEPDMKWTTQPRTMLELAAVRACHPEHEADSALSERVDRMEHAIEKGALQAPPKAAEKAKPAPAQANKSASGAPARPAARPAGTPPQAYLDAVSKIREEIPSVGRVLGEMRFIDIDGSVIHVEFDSKQIMMVKVLERKSEQMDAILSEAFGQPMRIHLSIAGQRANKTSAAAKDVIEQSYDVFGRENIELTD